jgi:GntR family transcriptional regulator, transcriptional repressor for pyruvate dehydrogenase complex
VRRLNLVREVVEQLRNQILAGRFPPDAPMPPEGQLCEGFGVSRTVIREAMRTLQAQGLVEVSQGRLPRVRPVDSRNVVETLGTFLQRGNHSLLNLIEVRRPLESEIAGLAAQRATPEQIEALRQAVRQMAAARALDSRVEADLRFHDLLATATGNPVFPLLLSVLADLMRQSRRQTISATGLERALAGHRAVLAAVEDRDPVQARKTMLDHLDLAEHDLQEAEQ